MHPPAYFNPIFRSHRLDRGYELRHGARRGSLLALPRHPALARKAGQDQPRGLSPGNLGPWPRRPRWAMPPGYITEAAQRAGIVGQIAIGRANPRICRRCAGRAWDWVPSLPCRHHETGLRHQQRRIRPLKHLAKIKHDNAGEREVGRVGHSEISRSFK